jgi:DNA-binding NarL/FixJ family response regulator
VEGFRRLLEEPAGSYVVSGAYDRRDALRALNDTDWKLVILDGALRGETAIELLADLRVRAPEVRVLWLAESVTDPWLRRAMEGGAAGLAHRAQSPGALRAAVRAVLDGQTYVADILARPLLFLANQEDTAPHHRLTDRELQVLRLLAAGWEPREIGKALAISVKTVATHRARVQRKLGCRNRAQAMAYAIRNGLMGDAPPG